MMDNLLGILELALLIVELLIFFCLVKHILALERHEKMLEKKVEELKTGLRESRGKQTNLD